MPTIGTLNALPVGIFNAGQQPDPEATHPQGLTPSRRTTTGAVTTGRQNTTDSPADGTRPSTVTATP